MKFVLEKDYIQLDKLLKITGVADSGGAAHLLVDDRKVYVNSVCSTEKRKKIKKGDIVVVDNVVEQIIIE